MERFASSLTGSILSHSSLPFDSSGWLALGRLLFLTLFFIFQVLARHRFGSFFYFFKLGREIDMYFIYKDKSISQKVWRNKFIYISMYIASGLQLSTAISSETHKSVCVLSSLSKCRHLFLRFCVGNLRTRHTRWVEGGRSHLAALTTSFTFSWQETRTPKRKSRRKKTRRNSRSKFAYTVVSTSTWLCCDSSARSWNHVRPTEW